MPAKKSKVVSGNFDNSRTYKLLALVVVVAVFAVLGVKLLGGSGASPAASTPTVGYVNFQSAASVDGVDIANIQDAVAGIGLQTVTEISPGKQLTYVMGGKVVPTSVCYYLRASNPKSGVVIASASVTLANYGSSRTVNLPVDDNYREVCVPSGKQAQISYNVANNSSGAYVMVYQALLRY